MCEGPLQAAHNSRVGSLGYTSLKEFNSGFSSEQQFELCSLVHIPTSFQLLVELL